MFALDVLGGTIQSTGLGFDEGDADRPCCRCPARSLACPGSARRGADAGRDVRARRSPFFGDPRHVLERVLGRFAQHGLTPVMAVELEFYFVDRERTPQGHAQPPRQPLSAAARTRPRSTRWRSSTSTRPC